MSGDGFSLEPGEKVLWQSSPAPRAFVFRRWRLSLACGPVWLWLGYAWVGARSVAGAGGWYGALWLLAGWGAFGHLLAARLSWPGVKYLLTDRWLRVRRPWPAGPLRRWPVAEIEPHQVVSVSGGVKTVRLRSRSSGRFLTLHCLESAEVFLGLLDKVKCR